MGWHMYVFLYATYQGSHPYNMFWKKITFLGFFSVISSVQFWFLRACYQSQLHELYHMFRRLIIFILWFCSSCCYCYKHDIRIYENKTNKCAWRYVNLLYYGRCKPSTCFGHLQRCVLRRIYYKDNKTSVQI
jgi:hypothetical protein